MTMNGKVLIVWRVFVFNPQGMVSNRSLQKHPPPARSLSRTCGTPPPPKEDMKKRIPACARPYDKKEEMTEWKKIPHTPAADSE